MLRTVDVPGEQIHVSSDVGPGRILRATLLIEENSIQSAFPCINGDDALDRELDELLAITDPASDFVDDSREAIYTPDDEIVQ